MLLVKLLVVAENTYKSFRFSCWTEIASEEFKTLGITSTKYPWNNNSGV